jgi:glycosyltransferase involved in cell wall biosynthesis
MKILQCLPYYAEQLQGGIQKYVYYIIMYLKEDFDIDIYTTTAYYKCHSVFGLHTVLPEKLELQPGRQEKGHKKIIPLNTCSTYTNTIYRTPSLGMFWNTPLAPFFPRGLKKLAARNYDLVHFHSPNLLSDLTACLLPEQKYVVSIHDTNTSVTASPLLMRRLAGYFFQRNLLRAERIIVYRKSSLYALVKQPRLLPALLHKTIEIPPGVDGRNYTHRGLKRNEDVLFITQDGTERSLRVFIEAGTYLQHKQARLVVMVKTACQKKYFQALLTKARNLLQERLVVITNPADEQVGHTFQQCGCLVCPGSALEHWFFLMLEAASCGTALVKIEQENIAWLKEPFCLTAKANDVLDLADKIDLALEQKEELGRLAALYVKRYNWERTASLLKEVYLASFRKSRA